MRGTLLLALFLTALFPLNSALADRVAFPPDNCTGTNPFMAFNGVTAGGNTYCINGQSVLNNALLPGCNDGQAVTYEGGKFVCKTVSTHTPPTCSAGQFLTYNGTSFSCTSTNVPTCQANYVLTYNGSAFVCVPKTASVPTCAANQFLTYNGTSFQCAATQTLTVPTCAAGQILTGSGGQLVCAPGGTGSGFNFDYIGSFSGMGTKTLPAGKKFSDYKVIIAQTAAFPGNGANPYSKSSVFIPITDFVGGYAFDIFTHVDFWEGAMVAWATVKYTNDTSFYLYGSNSAYASVILSGIK